MSDLSRVEQLLRNALGEDLYEVTPQSRVEALLVELNELIEGMDGSVSPEDIATAVAAYLDEHLTNPTNPPVDTSLSISGAAADAKKTGDELSDLKEGLTESVGDLKNALSDITTEELTPPVSISLTWSSGCMDLSGNVSANESYIYSDKVPVKKGDVLRLYRSDDGVIGKARFVTAFLNNVAVSDKGWNNVNAPYTIPDGVDEVVFTVSSSYPGGKATKESVKYVVDLTGNAEFEALTKLVGSVGENCIRYAFASLTGGNTYQTTENYEDMCGYKICFFAKISSITGEIKIGKGIGLSMGGGIGFDGTNLYEYQDASASPVRTQAHGLTIKDYVGIVFEADYTSTAKLVISTNGGNYTWNIPYWVSRKGTLTVYSALDTLSSCCLTYTCEGLIKETWLYGDSYFSNTSDKRWTVPLIQGGYRNFLLNAYPGRASTAALASLKIDLLCNRLPKRIVWCMGMNDKDGASAANEDWESCLEEVEDICEDNKIELILATIPNVPSSDTKNTYKNAIVENSGYRYIDFAKAISPDGGTTCYVDMLEDQVHPNPQGALCLYNCAVTTVPELLF